MINTETIKDLQNQWQSLLTCEETGVMNGDQISDIMSDKLYDIGMDWQTFMETFE